MVFCMFQSPIYSWRTEEKGFGKTDPPPNPKTGGRPE